MKKIALFITLLAVIGLAQAEKSFQIISPAFETGGKLATEFTCYGAGVMPPVMWFNPPKGTKSFVLTIRDPDARKTVGHTMTHLAAYDIPASVTNIPQGATNFISGMNGYNKPGYIGMCPPAGFPHHYYFTLYALSVTKLDVPIHPTYLQITTAFQPYLLGEAEMVGTYENKK